MSIILAGFILFLLLNLGAGMIRAYLGPSASDRMSAALLFGSTMVAILLLLAELDQWPALRDVAVLLVMLAAILSVAFVGMPGVSGSDVDATSPGEGFSPGSRHEPDIDPEPDPDPDPDPEVDLSVIPRIAPPESSGTGEAPR